MNMFDKKFRFNKKISKPPEENKLLPGFINTESVTSGHNRTRMLSNASTEPPFVMTTKRSQVTWHDAAWTDNLELNLPSFEKVCSIKTHSMNLMILLFFS